MGQLLLGVFSLASVVGAFWFIARMPPRETLFPSIPEGPPRAKEAWRLSPTDLILTIAAALGTALVLGMSIASHRPQDALVFAFNLVGLVVLLVFQVWALADQENSEFLKSSTGCGRVTGFLCTINGLNPRTPLDHVQLALVLLYGFALLGSLWWDNYRRVPAPA